MNNGAFGENFPYSNFHDMNMDWIIKIAKDFLNQYTHIQETISTGEESITETTNTGIEELNQKYADLEALLEQWYNTHSEDIAAELQSAINSFYNEAEDKTARLLQDIPTEYGDLSNDVRAMREAIPNFTLLSIYPHYIDNKRLSETGDIITGNGRIATEDYIDCKTSLSINYSIDSGYRLYIVFFDDNHNYVSNTGWITGSGTITRLNTYKYYRVCMAKVDETGGGVTVANDAYKASITQDYTLYINTLINRGVAYNIVDDLDNLLTIGMYPVNNPTGYRPAHTPDEFDGGVLFVVPAYRIQSTQVERYQLLQILFNGSKGQIFIRYCNSSYVWRNWINMADAINPPVSGITTNWLAMGDSIAMGVYSYTSGDGTATAITTPWSTQVASSKRYSNTILASRGMGYTEEVTGRDPDGGDTRISLSELLTRMEAMTDDFNLVTMQFGINDYNTPSVASLSTIETGLRNAINRITNKFKNAKLVVLTPFNCSNVGSESSLYGFRTARGGRTLQDIANKIRDVCTEMGVECLYVTNGNPFNIKNIVSLQPDGVHPSQDARGHLPCCWRG